MIPHQAVILAGGRGERLRPLTDHVPKPMVEVVGVPFLQHLIVQAREQGITEVVLLTGYLSDQIERYFGDGEKFGVKISYSEGEVDWNTGKRLVAAESLLSPRFFLLYGDNFVHYNLRDLAAHFAWRRRSLSFVVTEKLPGNVAVNLDGDVLEYSSNRRPDLPLVELGFMIATRDPLLHAIDNDRKAPLGAALARLALKNAITSTRAPSKYLSISDPTRLAETRRNFESVTTAERRSEPPSHSSEVEGERQ